jgi:predicted amidophosphoribosyltransferase
VAKLTVEEAAATYVRSMRNVLPAGPGVCAICGTFIQAGWTQCYQCEHQPEYLDAVVPVTYSEHLGQMHTALRGYKDGGTSTRSYAGPRVAAILWRFLELHEACVARAAGAQAGFEIVTTVPSSTKARDRHNRLRTIVGWCRPVKERLDQLLEATDRVPTGRHFDSNRYAARRSLNGEHVLLIDDTWTTGGHGQSAACTLKAAGAGSVGLVVVGRHVRPDWEVGGATTRDLLDALPKQFDWGVCRVHG